MKQRWKLLPAILAALALVLAGLAWSQRENLKIVWNSLRYSQTELEQQMEDNQKIIRDAVEAAPGVSVRDVTEEERQALRDGSMTREELTESLLNTGTVNTGGGPAPQLPASEKDQPAAEATKPVQLPQAEKEDVQSELSALVAKVYVLREEYTMALDDLYSAAKTEYKTLPQEKRSKKALTDLAGSYIDRANALEVQCDGQMDEIVTAMESLIRANGGDMALVDKVVYTYANEKSLKKAWYMSELEKKGLV